MKTNIPGVSYVTEGYVFVSTDGGPWAHHNFPCPVCKDQKAVMNLDGWIFEPCRDCQENGWELRQRQKLPWWKRCFT